MVVIALQQEDKFVATDPGNGVAAAQRTGQSLGQGAQGLVTGRLPPFVIDTLEAVEVQIAHRHAAMLPVGVAAGCAQSLFQQLAVGQAGQIGVGGRPVEFARRGLECGDVREGRHMVILPGFFQMHAADG